jgi:hypothetical protein
MHTKCEKKRLSILIFKGAKGGWMKIHASPYPNKHGSSWKQRVIIKFNNSSIIPHNDFFSSLQLWFVVPKQKFSW